MFFKLLGIAGLTLCLNLSFAEDVVLNNQAVEAVEEVQEAVSQNSLDEAISNAVENLLVAYNNLDYTAFYANFSESLKDSTTEESFNEIYKDNFMANFGKITAYFIKSNDNNTSLVYTASSELVADFEITIDLVNEADSYKFTRVNFEKIVD